MTTKVTYLDNSGFIVETDSLFLVFDYWRDPAHKVVKSLEHQPDKPVTFLVSHNHRDHFNPEIFNLGQNHRRVFVLSNDIASNKIRSDMPVEWMSAGDIAENLPGDITIHAYGSTDAGVSYVVQFKDGFTIFHAGDLNNWHWDEENTESEARKAKEHFTNVINRIADDRHMFDIAFFPVDTRQGENCASGAEQFLDKFEVHNFFPMHFNGDFGRACDFEEYKLSDAAARRSTLYCLHKPGQSIEIKL